MSKIHGRADLRRRLQLGEFDGCPGRFRVRAEGWQFGEELAALVMSQSPVPIGLAAG